MPDQETDAVQRAPESRLSSLDFQQPAVIAQILPPAILRSLPQGRLANEAHLPLPSPQPGDVLPDLADEMIRQAAQPARQSEQPLHRTGSATTPPVIGSQAPAQAVQRKSVQPSATNPPGNAAGRPTIAPPSSLEQDWPRLQRILRGHQEVEPEIPDQQAQAATQPVEMSTGTKPESPAVQRLPEPERLKKPVITEIDTQPPASLPGQRPGASAVEPQAARIQAETPPEASAEEQTQLHQAAPAVQPKSEPRPDGQTDTFPTGTPALNLPPSQEQDWPRLQRILRGHQEVEPETPDQQAQAAMQPVEMSTGTKLESPAVQRLPEPERLKKPVITEIDTQRPASLPAQRPGASELEPQAERIQAETLPEASPEEQSQLHQAAPPVQKPNATRQQPTSHPESGFQQIPAVQPKPEPRPDAQTYSPSTDTPALNLPPSGSTAAKPVQMSPETRAKADPPAAVGEDASEQRPAEDTSHAAYEQPLSLESAWPVQRKENRTLLPADPTIPQPTEEEEILPTDMAGFQQVQEMLASIAVEQPTDSQVEIITPRKPRPKTPGAVPPVQTTVNEPGQSVKVSEEKEEGEPFSKIPVDNRLVDSVPQGSQQSAEISQNESSRPALSGDSFTQSESTPVQRQSDPASDTTWVNTEIGPLPADLWRLVGEQPPVELPGAVSTHPAQKTGPGMEQTGTAEKTSSQSDAAAESAGAPAAARSFSSVQRAAQAERPPVLFRAPETTAQAPPTAPAQSAQTGDETAHTESTQENEVDTDELAQKVYSYLKRKLMVEWERFRKRK